jgi:hypothetical protein
MASAPSGRGHKEGQGIHGGGHGEEGHAQAEQVSG